MARLKKIHKIFIVQQFAFFKKPQEISDLVKEEFGIEVPRQQVFNYNPENAHYDGSDEWKKLHKSARESYLKEVNAVPIANLRERLEMYQKVVDKWKKSDERNQNDVLLLTVLEQVAKETGGMYTNKRHISQELTVTTKAIVQQAQNLANLNGTTVKEELEFLVESKTDLPEIIVEDLKTNYLN